MAWYEISATTSQTEVESLTAVLEALGALAISYYDAQNQPILEPLPNEIPLWQKVIITGLFPIEILPEQITYRLNTKHPNAFIAYKILPDQDWSTAWQEYFKPMKFGRSLWIYPSNETPPKESSDTVVHLDPGLAFGTGTHPTTRLCLEWLAHHSLTDQTVIDFGCGTSILAISALKLGAHCAYGIDHDHQALLSSESNAQKNQIPSSQLILLQSIDQKTPACDLVIANILLKPLLSLRETLADLCQPNGIILLSGILKDQAETLKSAYEPWFEFGPYCLDEDWVLLVGHKKLNRGVTHG